MRNYIVSKKKKLDEFLKANIVYVTPIMLLGGFFIHTITFDRVDRVFEHVVLVFYMCLAGACIALLVSRGTSLGERFKVSDRSSIITAIVLFSFGSLFSGFLIFYAKSGSLLSSWPFVLLLLVLMLGPEFRKGYYREKLVLQIIIFYIAIFCYLIFSVPVVVKHMGPWIYLLSGGISLIIISGYLFILRSINRRNFAENRRRIVFRVASTFLVFNFLYFTNIIPPIPLSLTFRAVYHDFTSVQAVQYKGFYEQTPWWNFWKKRSNVFHRQDSEKVYVFSQIYAPVNLSLDIYHKWEYFDPQKTRWVPVSSVRIPITGGRKDGFRGFSEKSNITPGVWRVRITTSRNQTIGQIVFRVKSAEKILKLKEETY